MPARVTDMLGMTTTQPDIQPDTQRAPSRRKMPEGRPFRAGKSPNPGGRTRAQRIAEERTRQFSAEFRRIHGRRPYATERATLAAAGALAAQIEHCRLSADDICRQSNSLWRLLSRVGLGSPPAADDPAPDAPPPAEPAFSPFEAAKRMREARR